MRPAEQWLQQLGVIGGEQKESSLMAVTLLAYPFESSIELHRTTSNCIELH